MERTTSWRSSSVCLCQSTGPRDCLRWHWQRHPSADHAGTDKGVARFICSVEWFIFPVSSYLLTEPISLFSESNRLIELAGSDKTSGGRGPARHFNPMDPASDGGWAAAHCPHSGWCAAGAQPVRHDADRGCGWWWAWEAKLGSFPRIIVGPIPLLKLNSSVILKHTPVMWKHYSVSLPPKG